jgi:predicted membrane channel-forming protein YqfA (hemolysin III family)
LIGGVVNKRPLQIATGLLGAIPVITGIITMLGVFDPIYASAGVPPNALLDSNLRFFGGVWLGLGLAIYWMIPNIEKQTALFRIIWGMIFLGGIGRALSMIFVGVPPVPFIGFTVLEIVGAPLFVAWQARVAKA